MKNLKTRIAAAHKRSRGNLRLAFRNESGAFDLPSILVGVLVVAVMALGVMAVVFGIIPFSQDKSAEQSLAAIATAQGTYYSQSTDPSYTTNAANGSSYSGLADLKTQKLMGTDVGATGNSTFNKIDTWGGTTGWVAVVKSESGKWYVASHDKPAPTLMAVQPVQTAIASTVISTEVGTFTGTPPINAKIGLRNADG